MNLLQKAARIIIKKSFDYAVSTIESFHEMKTYDKKVSELRKLNNDTLGKEIANCLDINNLSMVPKFESHDLKHVLLDYKMTPEDEIRLQAFMVGNGNYSIPSLIILSFGFVLLPDLWKTFYTDFKKGRKCIPISKWNIEEYKNENLKRLRFTLTNTNVEQKNIFDVKRIARFGAYLSISAGIFGMLFCLPFLFSSNIADLVGAGFPFLGGAILSVGGLLALTNLAKPNKFHNTATLVNNA